MEFKNINTKPSSDCETSFYENMKITSAPLQSNANSKPEQPVNEEGLYEQLRLERKTPSKEEDTIKRIKYFVCINLALCIVLCITVIALIIVVAVPKNQDGGWTRWGSWVSCSESCGGGIQSRTRTCSNPLPSMTGKFCDGNPVEVKTCNKESCTDGGWTRWGSWVSCSESCGGGIQSRTRTCLFPLPSMTGKYCDGSPVEVKTCNKESCTDDGGWTSWGSWASCSESCGIGVQIRARTCSNPLPSLTEKYCDGRPVEVKTCYTESCTDGRWSLWENWGSCTESCGGGVRTRSRSFINPNPSLTGRSCAGGYTDVSTCNKTTCPEHSVAFTAYDIYGNSSNYATLLFQKTYINIGNAYDTNTGKFTCNVPGVYHFAVTLTKVYQDIYSVSAYLRINGSNKLMLYLFPKHDNSNEVGVNMLSGAGTFYLNRNDVVDVNGVPNYFMNDYFSYFTGFLITPDQ